METLKSNPLKDFVHDVCSEAGLLKEAAWVLEQSKHERKQKILGLMAQKARKLAKTISDFEAGCRE